LLYDIDHRRYRVAWPARDEAHDPSARLPDPLRAEARHAAADPARLADLEGYARLLADPDTARFIASGGKPRSAAQAWAEAAFLIGHWQLLGCGMFLVEDRETRAFVGRVGALHPQGWPGFEIAWAITPEARGQGYAVEAARAATAWAFATFAPPRIVSIIHPLNGASRRVAEKLGERPSGRHFSPLGEPCEIWELSRSDWKGDDGPL
jgi:RimJ/RimL family protein N-acetyltransferase